MAGMKPAEPQAAVIFGASGDLTRRKLLPAFWHLFVEGLLPDGFAIVGYARSEMTNEGFQRSARDAIKEFGKADPGRSSRRAAGSVFAGVAVRHSDGLRGVQLDTSYAGSWRARRF